MNVGEHLKALRFTDMVLAVDAENKIALEVRIASLGKLRSDSVNVLGTGWLVHGIKEAQKILGRATEAGK